MWEAAAVLNATGGEANIRKSICRLLTALGHHYVPEHETGAGRADIFLPRSRTIIETKDQGGAVLDQSHGRTESPLDQLSRYVKAKMRDERNSKRHLAGHVKWTGMVTDGQVWHHWSFENRPFALPQVERLSFKPRNGSELANWLSGVLAA